MQRSTEKKSGWFGPRALQQASKGAICGTFSSTFTRSPTRLFVDIFGFAPRAFLDNLAPHNTSFLQQALAQQLHLDHPRRLALTEVLKRQHKLPQAWADQLSSVRGNRAAALLAGCSDRCSTMTVLAKHSGLSVSRWGG